MVEQGTQDAFADRKVSDLPHGRIVHSRVQERDQATVGTPDAQRTIASPGQFHGRSDDPLQRRVKVEIRGDADDHLDEQLSLLAGGRQTVQLHMYLIDQYTVVGQT